MSAQSNPQGVPKELLEAKKLELIQEKVRSILQVLVIVKLKAFRLKLKRPRRRRVDGGMTMNVEKVN